MVMVFSTHCFSTFAMSDTVEHALGGDPWSLVKGPGYVAIALFATSGLMQFIFYKWAAVKVNALPETALDDSEVGGGQKDDVEL